jgi:glycerol-3-phosphate acyltransferase PlsY
MDDQKQSDHVLTAVIVTLLVMLFVLDLLTPLGIATWALYIIPLGLTSWSSIRSLLPITAIVCSVLVLLGYFYSPPGVSFEYVVINRALGIVMLWAAVFFLWSKRDERESLKD